MSAYNFKIDESYQTYLMEGIIDSSVEKPFTIDALCQNIREEFQVYQLKSYIRLVIKYSTYPQCFIVEILFYSAYDQE
jgi:hypothetical protein